MMAGIMRHIVSVRGIVIVALLLYLLFLPYYASAFYINVFTRILIWAIAGISLNLILGYGGMISFGHAAYLGVAAYTVLAFAEQGIYLGWVQWPVAIILAGVVSAFIGTLCLRTRGLHFIMITLAFTQMLFFFFRSLDRFRGDDGLRIKKRSEFDFGWFELDLMDRLTFYYLVFAILLVALLFVFRLVNSRFGAVLRGSMSNDVRMQAIGVSTYGYRLTAFVIAGMMCGVAGLLMANMERFVSPAVLSWTVSGDLIFIVVLGGSGRLFGPVFGALVFFLLIEFLGDITIHWQLIMGPFLVLVVLFARTGIDGALNGLDHKLRVRFGRGQSGDEEMSS